MKLIIGIGNPEEKYRNNRHNVGRVLADKLKTQSSKLKGVLIRKTDVSMNQSGIAVKKLVEQYKVNTADLWVIHDDLDIKLRDYKIQSKKGPKDHNGILSIEKELGSKDFYRVRVGIDNRSGEPFDSAQGKDYVLQDFTKKEKEILGKVMRRVVEELVRRLAVSRTLNS